MRGECTLDGESIEPFEERSVEVSETGRSENDGERTAVMTLTA